MRKNKILAGLGVLMLAVAVAFGSVAFAAGWFHVAVGEYSGLSTGRFHVATTIDFDAPTLYEAGAVSVTGTVKEAVNGAAVPGAAVSAAYYAKGNGSYTEQVDATLINQAGEYRAVMSYAGYQEFSPVTAEKDFTVLSAPDYYTRLLKFKDQDALSLVTGGMETPAIAADEKAADGFAMTRQFGHPGGGVTRPLVVQLGSVWTVGEIAELRIRYRLTEITAGGSQTFWPRFYFNDTAWDAQANATGISITATVGQDMADYATLAITHAELLTKYPYLMAETALSRIGLLGPSAGGAQIVTMNLDSITVVTREEAAATYPALWTFDSVDALSIVSGGLGDAAAIDPDEEAEDGYALTRKFGFSDSAMRPLAVQLGAIWTVGEIAEIQIRYRLTDIEASIATYWPRFSFNGTAWNVDNGAGFTITARPGQDMADYATLVMTQASLLDKYPYLTPETALSQIMLSSGGTHGTLSTAILHLDSITVVTRAERQAQYSALLTFSDEDALSIVTGGMDTPAIVPDEKAEDGFAMTRKFGHPGGGVTRPLVVQLGSAWTVGEIAEIRFRYRLTDIATGGATTFWPRFYFNDTAWDNTSQNGNGGNGITLTATVGQDMADYVTLVITQAYLLDMYGYLTTETALSRIGLLGPMNGSGFNTAVMNLDSITIVPIVTN
ncbi:MAG: carboxypeptidase-like regulatory domain-containing protein [Clostridiales bacterium]|jgi:succinate dehydrogenase flavin-adding protein (antitoxin of CptAB toxin-antitoxin module)|nr:carboxypeptidase-like regulatory domain-containing protein [Clostridiales bacterium]